MKKNKHFLPDDGFLPKPINVEDFKNLYSKASIEELQLRNCIFRGKYRKTKISTTLSFNYCNSIFNVQFFVLVNSLIKVNHFTFLY